MRSLEAGTQPIPPRAAVHLGDVLALDAEVVAGLAPQQIRIDTTRASPLAREAAVLLAGRWPLLTGGSPRAQAALAGVVWLLRRLGDREAPREPRGVYVAAVALREGLPGQALPHLHAAPPGGVAAEIQAGRVVYLAPDLTGPL